MDENQSCYYMMGDSEGEWTDVYDLGSDQDYIFRIKAYTNDTDQKTTFELNRTFLLLEKGGRGELSALIATTVLNRAVVWNSSDENVVTVENGPVTAQGLGKATVTATMGNRMASCEVTVSEKSVSSGEGTGTITDDKSGTAGEGSGTSFLSSGKTDMSDVQSQVKRVGRASKTGDIGKAYPAVYTVLVLCGLTLSVCIYKKYKNKNLCSKH